MSVVAAIEPVDVPPLLPKAIVRPLDVMEFPTASFVTTVRVVVEPDPTVPEET